MFVPVVARSVGPWNCLDDAAYCSPYFSNSPIAYFTQPHRGIDLRADEGETPVHAPYSGTVYSWGTSSMQLIFDAPYNGMSSYYAHMASNDGGRDYRVARGGDHALAGESLLGFVGSFGTNAAWPHLHLAFSAKGNGAEGNWPTLDPTPFLSALDLVYFPGWSGQRSPVRCAAERADAFEPDNFHSAALTMTVDSAPQRHDFHAPNDDDWSAVELVAGITYRIETLDLEARSDTQLAIFDAQGERLLAANDDDSGLAAGLDYSPPTSGRYLVRVRHSSWRGYTFEASGRARYSPPVYGSDTGYSLRVATNLLLGREVTSLLDANATTGAPAALSNDGLLETAWVGGCPLELPDNPVTPG
ncbi:MAG: M23 family metallopeptidase, partial [Caldilineaceae bacterium]